MLNKVKTALRLTTTAYDDELQDLINACKADLGLTDIYTINDDDVLIIRCVILYCKMYFGTPNDMDSKRLKQAYDELKASMLMSSKYTDYTGQGGGDMVIDSSLSSTSTNAVQNKVITVALENAVSQITANTDSISVINTKITDIYRALHEIDQAYVNVLARFDDVQEKLTADNGIEITAENIIKLSNAGYSIYDETQSTYSDVTPNSISVHDESGNTTFISKNELLMENEGGYTAFSVNTASNTVSMNDGIKNSMLNALGFKGETQIKGWVPITPNTYETLNISQAIADGKKRFTILVYARKGSNRQVIKFELTLTELDKLLSKATTNELTITRSCAGITNSNNIALCKQTVKRVYDGDVALEGVLDIKYQIYEGGNAVTGLDNFECCIYAE